MPLDASVWIFWTTVSEISNPFSCHLNKGFECFCCCQQNYLASVFVDRKDFAAVNFTCTSLAGPVCHINMAGDGTSPGVVGATTGATPPTADQIVTTGVATTNAANQALITQQNATAAAIDATFPTKFNLNNLPPNTKAIYKNHLNPSYLMTATDMQPFQTPIWGVCPVLFYLEPSMGSSVTRQPDSNQIIIWNGQLFSLAYQGNK